MAIEDNRSITTNMEEIFLLQSIDGGGAGGGGSFSGDHLTIGAALNHNFGIPSISVGANSFGANANSFAMGNECVAAGYNSLSYGDQNANFGANVMVLGAKNSYPPIVQQNDDSNIILGSKNKVVCNVYDSNWNLVSNTEAKYGYYDKGESGTGYFYTSLAFSEETKMAWIDNTFYYDLFEFDKEGDTDKYNNTAGIYFRAGNETQDLDHLNRAGYHCQIITYTDSSNIYGNTLIGDTNTLRLYKTEAYCNILIGGRNTLNTRNQNALQYNIIIGSYSSYEGASNFLYNTMLGYSNSIKNLISTSQNVQNNYIIGDTNSVTFKTQSDAKNNYLIGYNNQIAPKDDGGTEGRHVNNMFVIGHGNIISNVNKGSNAQLYVYGHNNRIEESNPGYGNSGLRQNIVIGHSNKIEKTNYDFYNNIILGDNIDIKNTLTPSGYNVFLGHKCVNLDHAIDEMDYNIFGTSNRGNDLYCKAKQSLILGTDNHLALSFGIIQGEDNKVYGARNFILGARNKVGYDLSAVSQYNSSTSYDIGDICYKESAYYYCKAATTGNAPPNSTYWNTLSVSTDDPGSHTFTFGTDNTNIGQYTFAFGNNNNISKTGGSVFGESNIVSADYANAEGNETTASGDYSHAEGYQTTASGDYSHTEGSGAVASGDYSHAEGENTTASGAHSHAEGNGTIANGSASHAGGRGVQALGDNSFAHGSSLASDGYNVEYYFDLTEFATSQDEEKYYFNNAISSINQIKVVLSKFDNIYSSIYINSGFGFYIYDQSTGGIVGGGGASFIAIFSSPDYSNYISLPAFDIPANSYILKSKSTVRNGQGLPSSMVPPSTEGKNSIALGHGPQATGDNQTVIGRINALDENKAFIIGNGTIDISGNPTDPNNISWTRSNALTVDWDGNQILAGKLTVGTQPTVANDVTTKTYVDGLTSPLDTRVTTLEGLAVDYTGATSSADGVHGFVPAATINDRLKYLRGDGTWSMLELVEMEYGESNAWSKFIDAYNAKSIVYCRASSSTTDPSSGSKTRKAFMAYVNNETNPTEVEFQYYRSIASNRRSVNQQADEVHIYKLASSGQWNYEIRRTCVDVKPGTNMTATLTGNSLTLNASTPTLTRPEISHTATQGQTNFEIDANYDSEPIDVYVNGIRRKDYTIVTGTNMKEVQFSSGLAGGEEVDIIYIKLTMV